MSNITETVINAVLTLHNATDSKLRKEANTWLVNFADTLDAWDVSIQLLDHPELKLKFYGATTLATKINHPSWFTYPPERQLQISQAVFFLLSKSVTFPDPVMKQICLACSRVGARTMSTVWPGFFNEIIKAYEQTSDIQQKRIIVKVLSQIPEDINSPNINPSTTVRNSQTLTSRNALKNFVSTQAEPILLLVLNVLTTMSDKVDLVKESLECLSQWIPLGVNFELLVKYNLFSILFPAILHLPYTKSVVNVFSSLFGTYGSNNTDPREKKGMHSESVSDTIFQGILNLRSVYQQALKDDNNVLSEQIVELVSSFGCGNSGLICRGLEYKYVGDFLTLCLECTMHPKKWVASTMLDFWYFVVELKNEDLLKSLLQVLFNQLLYPIDMNDPEEDEEFYETMKNFRNSSTPVISEIFQCLQPYFFGFLQSSWKSSTSWNQYEVTIHVLTKIGPLLARSDDNSNILCFFVDQTIVLLQNKPEYRNAIFLDSTFKLFDQFSGAIQVSEPLVLRACQFLIHGLSTDISEDDRIIKNGCTALKSLCTDSSDTIFKHFDSLVESTSPLFTLVETKQCESLLVEALSVVCFKNVDPVSCLSGLMKILEPVFKSLETLSTCKPSDKVFKFIHNDLESIAGLFSQGKKWKGADHQQHPLLMLMQVKVMKIIMDMSVYIDNQITTKNSNSDMESNPIIETVYKIFNEFLNSVGVLAAPVVQNMMMYIIQTIQKSYYPFPYQTLSNLTDIFKQQIPIASNVISESLNKFQQLPRQQYSDVCYTVKNFMEYLTTVCCTIPDTFVSSPSLMYGTIAFGSTALMSLQEEYSIKAILDYIQAVIENDVLSKILLLSRDTTTATTSSSSVQTLVLALLHGIVQSSVFKVVTKQSKIFYLMLSMSQNQISTYALSLVGTNSIFPQGKFTLEQEKLILSSLLRNQQEGKFLEIVRTLRSVIESTKPLDHLWQIISS
eukprot:TRINITY_DN3096_c0_g2_i1.p1 TRINITY_DN3096_c0_g2~~TRINITY_DN3096_c0_g2_i1.p1  ORF type:complete len:958 (+),score=187.80 TRINITY_DN3096_c0_g2_i1:1935-4808(+)